MKCSCPVVTVVQDTAMLWDRERGSVLVNALGTNEAQERLQTEAAEGFLLPQDSVGNP